MTRSFRLHSKYNPQKEADDFASNIKTVPLYIVITEPGESYLASSFRRKFPQAKLFAIRYTSYLFLDSDVLFDAVWRYGSVSITFFLINNIPEEYFSKTAFISWKPSDSIWKEESQYVWKEIKTASEAILSIIRTRSFFGHVWAKNIFNNIVFSKHIKKSNMQNIQDSVFLTSGPSLENFIKDKSVLDKLKNSFCVCASSTLSALIYRNIKPNLCFATDGGFWAGEHIKRDFDIVFAFPLEARIPHGVLENALLSFINYGSAIEQYFFSKLDLPCIKSKRNGTVSGTVIDFLLDYTHGNIFVSGLDLSFSKGFTHARPNENIENNLVYENRFNPLANILASSSFNSSSLSIYASWFASLPKYKKDRLFRIGNYAYKIEGISNISNYDFVQFYKQKKVDRYLVDTKKIIEKERKNILLSFFDNVSMNIKNEFFLKDIMDPSKTTIEKEMAQLLAFSDYIALIKGDDKEKLKFKNKIQEKISDFIDFNKRSLLNE